MHYTEEDIRKVWDSDMSEAEKRLATAGMVLSTTEANNLHCVLVGGLAVELYAAGNYATSDIDIVTVGNRSERETMESLGFHRYGRSWEIDGVPMSVEFPSAPLAGDLEKTRILHVSLNDKDYGEVTVISIEDLLVDRCGNWTVNHTDNSNPLDSQSAFDDLDEIIYYLMSAYDKQIDWDYLEKQAKAQSNDCYKAVMHFKKHCKKLRGDISPLNPKRQKVFASQEYQAYLQKILNFHGSTNTLDGIFMSKAQKFLSKNDCTWDMQKDKAVFLELCRDGYSPYRCQRIMFASPSCFKLNNHGKATYIKEFFHAFNFDKHCFQNK